MLMSSSVEIKFHSWPRLYEDVIYTPQFLSKVNSASFSNDNCYLVYVADKCKPEIIHLRENAEPKLIHTLQSLDDVTAVCFQLKTKRVVGCGTFFGQVALYDTQRKTISKLFGNVPSAVKHVDFNSTDEHLAVSCTSGSVVLYDANDGHCCGNYVISDMAEPTSLKFHPLQPGILAAASEEGVIMLWDTNTANKTFSAQTHTAAISGIAYGRIDHDVIVTVGEDSKFCVHDVGIKECIFRSSTQHGLSAVDVSPDGNTIAIGSQEGSVYMYDMRNLLQPLTCWKAHSTKVTKVMFQRRGMRKRDLAKLSGRRLFHDVSETGSFRRIVSTPSDSRSDLVPNSLINGTPAEEVDVLSTVLTTPRAVSNYVDKNEFLKRIRLDLLAALKRDADDLNAHLKENIFNLETYIQNEFLKMDMQMTQKFEAAYGEGVAKALGGDEELGGLI